MTVSICFAIKLSVVESVFIALLESKPQLEMNATLRDVVDGESVMLTCSLRYRTSSSSERNVHITIDHPGADVVDTYTKRDATEINSVVTVKVKSSKKSEEPTMFGPIQCKVEFGQPANDAVLAQNRVPFTAKIRRVPILCKLFDIFHL